MLARTPRVQFDIEPFDAVYAEARQLLAMHWNEVAPYRDLLALDPNVPAYQAMEKAGCFFIVTARLGGQLVGYVWMMLHRHLHYREVMVAYDDIHFLHPDHRRGWTGVLMIKAAETEARARGAQVQYLRTKAAQDHGAIFARLGYDPLDIVYAKRLDGG